MGTVSMSVTLCSWMVTTPICTWVSTQREPFIRRPFEVRAMVLHLETHLPPKTFKLMHTGLPGNHRSSLKIGYAGKNYEKHDYIITRDGHLLRYFGMERDMFYYRNMSARGADGTYPEFLSNVKLETAVQFTL